MRSASTPVLGGHGWIDLTIHGGEVFEGTYVVASVTEVAADHSVDIIGSAVFTVHSVAVPGNGDVVVEIQIDWDEDIPYRVTLFIDP